MPDALKNFQIMIRHLLRLRAIADVFSEVRENRTNFLSAKRLRGDERIIQRLARHEARNTPPHKLVMRSMVAEPAVLGSRQEKGTHQTHNVFRPQKVGGKRLQHRTSTLDSKPLFAKLRGPAATSPPAIHRSGDPAPELARKSSPSRPCPQSGGWRARRAAQGPSPD